MSLCLFQATSDPLVKKCDACGQTVTTPLPPNKIKASCRVKGKREGAQLNRKKATPPPEPIDWGENCPHRSESTGDVACGLCGQKNKRVEIYQCDLFGKAATRKYMNGKSPIQSCQECRQSPLNQNQGDE